MHPRTPVRSRSWAGLPAGGSAGGCTASAGVSDARQTSFGSSFAGGRPWREGAGKSAAGNASLQFAGSHALRLHSKAPSSAALPPAGDRFHLAVGSTPSSRSAPGSAQLMVVVESDFDVACWASLEEGWSEGAELPLIIPAGRPCSASFGGGSAGIEGTLVVEGFEHKVPFRVRSRAVSGAPGPGQANFVARPGQLRATEVACALAQPRGKRGRSGTAAEVGISRDTPAQLFVRIRRATDAELDEAEQKRQQEEWEEQELDRQHGLMQQQMLTTSCGGEWPSRKAVGQLPRGGDSPDACAHEWAE